VPVKEESFVSLEGIESPQRAIGAQSPPPPACRCGCRCLQSATLCLRLQPCVMRESVERRDQERADDVQLGGTVCAQSGGAKQGVMTHMLARTSIAATLLRRMKMAFAPSSLLKPRSILLKRTLRGARRSE
jgi:hypothetical protein